MDDMGKVGWIFGMGQENWRKSEVSQHSSGSLWTPRIVPDVLFWDKLSQPNARFSQLGCSLKNSVFC